jgi:hypothetical protein
MIEVGLVLTKDPVEREVVAKGSWYCISYAVRKDGTSMPAKDVLSYLSEGTWPDGEEVTMHADEQVDAYARIMHTMQWYADRGEGDRYESMNGLEDGIFEFKAIRARVAFFDTDGDGTHTPKWRLHDQASAEYPDSPTWHIPELDEHIRLCNGWPKRGQKAIGSDIAFARQVRSEDLSHDQQ